MDSDFQIGPVEMLQNTEHLNLFKPSINLNDENHNGTNFDLIDT